MRCTGTRDHSCRSNAQNRFISTNPLKVIIKHDVAFLEPAMGLERICNNAEDDSRKRTIAREKFQQCERIEQAEIGARIEWA